MNDDPKSQAPAPVERATLEYIQAIADDLAGSGLAISFLYGPSAGFGKIWSVDVLTKTGQTFFKPYAAHSLLQAAAIALHECEKRGWHKRAPFKISDDGKSITCNTCGRPSYNAGDVEHRYCGFCKKFHEGP